jgi:protein-S-isoprenylcysteine O-methyltransferase Ste14
MIYDALMRLPFATWVITSTLVQATRLIQLAPGDPVYPLHVAMRLSTITFLLLLAAATLLRSRPSTKAQGWEPRISALAGTFLMYGIVVFPRRELSPSAEVIAILFVMIGSAGSIAALSQLGRSFSIMAESRRLVTSGPYRWVRHPLYVAEEIAVVGLFVQFASIWTALLFALQIAFQLRRMHNEETVLSASLPEYDAYRRNTARLVPGIY